jgi:hypothetical protein
MSGRPKTSYRIALSLLPILFGVIGAFALFFLVQFPYRITYADGASFKRTYFLTAGAFSMGLIFGFVALWFTWKETNQFIKRGAWCGIFLSFVGLAFLCFGGNTGIHSITSALNVCINNQRSIGTAKEEWALHSGATNGAAISWNDIAAYFSNGFPICPEGGKYELGKVGESVTCSNPKHQILAP